MKERFFFIPLAGLIAIGLYSCVSATDPEETETESLSGGVIGNYRYETYSNPLNVTNIYGWTYDDEAPDPSFVKGDDGYFYVFTTGSGGGKCFRSTDCVNWSIYKEPVIYRPTWGDDYSDGETPNVWAPDAVKIGDQWIYYYSLSGWDNPIGVGYATSSSISGTFKDQGKLFTCEEIGVQNAIDPCIFIEDGRVYMAIGSYQGVALIELDETGTALLNGVEYQKENKILIAGEYVNSWNAGGFEGSYIIKKGGYYYYFGSQGFCCSGIDSDYRVVVARSTSIAGPYTDYLGRTITNNDYCGSLVVETPALASGATQEIAGPGHCSVFEDDAGDYWLLYHSYVADDNFSVRKLMLDKLIWTSDGWPYVEGYAPSYKEVKQGPLIAIN